MTTLFCFDFDDTVIDDDSDTFLIEQLWPEAAEGALAEYRQQRAEAEGRKKKLGKADACIGQEVAGGVEEASAGEEADVEVMGWPQFMHSLMGEFATRGISRKEVEQTLGAIPFLDSMKGALAHLASVENVRVVVLSNANTEFIRCITEAKGIAEYVDAVITNPAEWNADGRLEIGSCQEAGVPHGCERCDANQCKGKELQAYLAANPTITRVVYSGDGSNDFHPATTLGPQDYVLPRRGYQLHKMVEIDREAETPLVSCRVESWATYDDFSAILCRLADVARQEGLEAAQIGIAMCAELEVCIEQEEQETTETMVVSEVVSGCAVVVEAG